MVNSAKKMARKGREYSSIIEEFVIYHFDFEPQHTKRFMQL